MVTYLVAEQGINPRAVDGHGRTPVEVARRAQREDVVAFLERAHSDGIMSPHSNCMTTSFASEDAPCGEINCAIT